MHHTTTDIEFVNYISLYNADIEIYGNISNNTHTHCTVHNTILFYICTCAIDTCDFHPLRLTPWCSRWVAADLNSLPFMASVTVQPELPPNAALVQQRKLVAQENMPKNTLGYC